MSARWLLRYLSEGVSPISVQAPALARDYREVAGSLSAQGVLSVERHGEVQLHMSAALRAVH